MSDEHDSWLEGLGVTGFSSSDDDSSGATNSIVSGAKDLIGSAEKAKQALIDAGNDLQDAKEATLHEAAQRLKSGAYYAVGDDDDANAARAAADADADKRSKSLDKAGEDLDDARKQVVSDEDLASLKSSAENAESQAGDD